MSTDEQQRKPASAAARDLIAADKEYRDRWIGIFIGVLALLMALCTLVGSNVTKDANRLHIEAANIWNFFQAKNLRRQVLRLRIDELELQLARDREAGSAAAVERVTKQIEDYRKLDAQLTSDKQRNEGLDELFVRGKALEAERDVMLRKDPYFDWAQTLLQIAIVLASVCLVTGAVWLLYISAVLGSVGLLLMINGNWMLMPLPWLG